MKILVTGHAGFIGFHVSKWLLENGHEVHGFDTFNNYYDPVLKSDRHKILKSMGLYSYPIPTRYDVPYSIQDIIRVQRPDLVIHLAAYAGVRYSLEHPELYIENNIVFTQALIQACEEVNTPKVIYASTSSVMTGNELPWNEEQRVDRQLNPYAATKRFNEQQFQFSKIPYTVGLRFFTVYGPYGRPDMALFNFTENIIKGKPITVFNKGDMYRDFTYIDDVIQAFEILLRYCAAAGVRENDIFNIGRGEGVNLMDFIKEIENNVGKPAIINYEDMHPADSKMTLSNTDKLKQLGYDPKVSVQEGVKKFVDWYKSYYKVDK